MRWVGYIGAVSILVWALQFVELLALVSVSSLFFVAVLGASIVIASHGVSALSILHRALLRRLEPGEASAASRIAETGRRSFIGSGWVGVIIGAIGALQSIDDPKLIGVPLSLCLLSMLYGYGLALLVWLPLERSLSDVGMQ